MTDKATAFSEVEKVCKSIIANGSNTPTTEHEFSTMLNELAKVSKRDGETQAAAFTRIFTDPDNADIREAYALTKGYRPGTTD
jgi:hypothetical protein